MTTCLVCDGLTAGASNICGQCTPPYSRAWCGGVKSAELEKLIMQYKFHRNREAAICLAELLADSTPPLPPDCVVTWVPTIRRHVRLRGYDHAKLIAAVFARRKGLVAEPTLRRLANTVQRGASKRLRRQQAEAAFVSPLIEPATYVLIDDVYTTGATLYYAAKKLREAGAQDVWVAVGARQPLEK